MASKAGSASREGSASLISYLDGAIPCQFPPFESPTSDETHFTSTHIELAHADRLRALFSKDPEIARTTICLAWGLLLHRYIGQDDVSFAYQDITSAEDTLDVPVLRILFEERTLLRDLSERVRQLGQQGPHCISSVSLMHLCNTALIFDKSVGSVSKGEMSCPLSLVQGLNQVSSLANLAAEFLLTNNLPSFHSVLKYE
jgi:hypothetical protein